MKSAILNILFFLIISTSSGQTIEILGGTNMNIFDFQGQDRKALPQFAPEFGYSFGIGISNFKIDTLRMRVSLLIDNYKGKLSDVESNDGVNHEISAEVNKTTVGIGIYPLNISIRNRFHISFGGEISIKISDKTSGNIYSWELTPSTTRTIGNEPVRINKNLFFGINGRISYDIRIKQNWYISPQYKLYFGLTDEFENYELKIKSRRHCILIGVIRKMT